VEIEILGRQRELLQVEKRVVGLDGGKLGATTAAAATLISLPAAR